MPTTRTRFSGFRMVLGLAALLTLIAACGSETPGNDGGDVPSDQPSDSFESRYLDFSECYLDGNEADVCAKHFDPPDVTYSSFSECVDAESDADLCTEYFDPPDVTYSSFSECVDAESDADLCAEYFDSPDVSYGSYAECVDAGEDEAVCEEYFDPPSEEYLGDDECVGSPSLCEAYFSGDSLKRRGHEGEMHEAFA
jgi:hypothetical protein